MKVGCLCVSESRHQWRPHLFHIAAASYFDQTHPDTDIVVITGEPEEYEAALDGVGTVIQSDLRGTATVCARMDQGCRHLADCGCNLIAIWDDDDWKHPSFLAECVKQLSGEPYKEVCLGGCRHVDPSRWVVTGYLWGLYVNARHLWAEDLSKFPHISPWGYWGSTLVFRAEAWIARPWGQFTFPGQDPAWCRSWSKDQWAPPVDTDPYKALAFCHGDNIYQHCRGGGFDLKPWLERGVSESVREAIYKVREMMIADGHEPPQCNRPY